MDRVKEKKLKWLIRIIDIYQQYLSPDHSWVRFLRKQPACRYYPSCSQYMKEALNHYGLLKGLSLGIKRLGRCHPLAKGGFDPVISDNKVIK